MRKLLALTFLFTVVACSSESPATLDSDWAVPADFSTYTDDSGLFSISYPPGWELGLSSLPEIQATAQELLDSVRSELSLEQTSILFIAGVPFGTGGYHPSITMVVEPRSPLLQTIEAVTAAQILGLKSFVDEFRELSRETLSIDSRNAIILVYEATAPQEIEIHNLVMITTVGETMWSITCSTVKGLADFADYEDDCRNIARSLQIHN